VGATEMMERIAETSPRLKARISGAFHLLAMLTGNIRSGCGSSSRESREQLDEPARQKMKRWKEQAARHESRCTSNLYSALRVIENAWEHSRKV
jgi:hypothetical protein